MKTAHVRAGAALALFLFLISPGLAGANEEVYRKAVMSTVLIYRNDLFEGGSGTGFLIDAKERLVVTARHVVEPKAGGISNNIVAIFPETKDGEVIAESKHYRTNYKRLSIKAKVVFESVRRDMAVLQLERLPDGVKALALASNRARPGQTVHFIGNATDKFGCVFSYSQGYVRNAFRWDEMGANVVATTAPTNKGDSGGPMLNNLGEVVGFAIMSSSGTVAPKNSVFHDVQVTELSTCVTEMREALKEMRQGTLVKQPTEPTPMSKEVKPSVHMVKMAKDVLYQITVKGEGFEPDMIVDGITLSPNVANGQEAQFLYTAKETKEHRIQITQFLVGPVGKGSLPYTFTVTEAAFLPDNVVKGQELKLNEHVRQLSAGKSYNVTVRGKGFEPDLQVLAGNKSLASLFCDGRPVPGTNKEFEIHLLFTAPKTGDYRMVVAVGQFSPPAKGPLDYVINVVERKTDFSVNDELTVKDPHKIHNVKLQGGKTYQIDLSSTKFDAKLTIEDGAGNLLKTGTDVGELSARLTFTPPKTDVYRIVAGSHGNGVGPFSVTVAEVLQPGKK